MTDVIVLFSGKSSAQRFPEIAHHADIDSYARLKRYHTRRSL